MFVLPNMEVATQEDLTRAVTILRNNGVLGEDFQSCKLPLLLEDALAIGDQALGEARALLETSDRSQSQPVRMKGVFQRAESKNANGRIYPLQILEREVTRLQPLLKERRLLGELDHPQSAKIRVPFASHVVTNLWLEGNDMWGELEPLTTNCGKDLRALIHDRVKFGVSSRGTGNLRNEDRGLIVQENYRMLTFDIVSDPSTQGAYPSEVAENTEGVCTDCGNCGEEHHQAQLGEDTIEVTTLEEAVDYIQHLANRLL